MRRLVSITTAVAFLVTFGIASASYAQAAAQGRQGGGAARGGGGGGGQEGARAVTAALIVDMQLKMPPSQTGQTKVVQDNLVDPNLELKQYGLHENCNLTSGTPGSATTPYSLWSGECEQPFATMFRPKASSMDLTGTAKIHWTVKTSGFHVVRPIVKLLDGTMYAGEFASESVPLLVTSEFVPAAIRWIKLDPKRLVTISTPGGQFNYIWATPDLSKVDEVGFVDLMPGSGHGTGGYIHVSEFKVYGKAVPRAAATASR
jgi:hypothetical protein